MIKKLNVAILVTTICSAPLVAQYECSIDLFGALNYDSLRDQKADEEIKVEEVDRNSNNQAAIDQTNRQIEQQDIVSEEQRLKRAAGG